MLVLSRQKDETVTIGGKFLIDKLLDPFERDGLRAAALREDAVGSALRKILEHLAIPALVTINDIRGDKVRLAFDAPKACDVHRLEVYQAITREARAGAQVNSLKASEAAKTVSVAKRPSVSPAR